MRITCVVGLASCLLPIVAAHGGDDWALASYTSLGSAVTLSDRVEQLKAPVLLALLFAIPALMLYRTNKK